MQVIFSPAEVSSLRASWVGNGDSLDSDLAAAASSSSSSSTTGRQRRNSQRSAWGDLDDVGFGHNNYNHSNGASSAGAAAAATAGGNSSSRSNNRNGGGSNGQQQPPPGIVRNLGFGDHDIDGNHASADKDTGEAAAVAERFRQRSLQRQSSKLAESLPEGWAAELDPTTQVWVWGLIG